MKKSVALAISAALFGSVVIGTTAHGAQVLTPLKNGAGADLSTTGTTLPAGTVLPIDVVYSVTLPQTSDESGLGLKIQYDGTKFDPVVTYDVNGVQLTTSITNLFTKCMIASPSDQLVGAGPTREVVFGWIDTSIRTTPAAGAVGWPGTADPAAPGTTNGCLNPGSIVTTSTGVAAPVALFRMGLKSKTTFNGSPGNVSSNVLITTAGNISYANTGNVDTNKTIVVTAAAAPSISLTGASLRGTHTGVLAGTQDIAVAAAFGGGAVTAAAASDTTITTEPRRGAGVALDQFAVVLNFNVAPNNTSGAATVVSCLVWDGLAGVACPASPTISGVTYDAATNSAVLSLSGVTDQSRVRVRLANVNNSGVDAEMTVGFLVGDVQNDRATNTGDINQVKGQSGTLTPTVRFDINRDGAINTGDINAVKASSGRRLP